MPENEKLKKLIDDYFKSEDQLSPSSATAMGIHKYDDQLEDFSETGIRKMRALLDDERKRLNEIKFDDLDRDGKIKYHLLDQRMKSSRRFLDKTRQFENDPAFYAELSMQSIFLLMIRDFAPLENRLKSIASRLEKMPDLFKAARENLKEPPKVYSRVALEMLQGASSIIDKLLPRMAKKAPAVEKKINRARKIAAKAFDDYTRFIREELMERSTGDFAIGAEIMDEMLQGADFLDYSSDNLWEIGNRELEKCEQEVEEFVRKEFKTDKPWREVYREVKKNHPPADKVIQTYVEFLERARKFVEEHDIVDIPENQKLIATETPEFSRPLTPYAAMMPPAPFEEDQTSFLWVTPVDPRQSKEDQERQLRDSSFGKIQYVSLHEAYPGHHLQLVYANRVKDHLYKRTGSNIFVEGWAFYCEQLMKDMGYFNREGELCQLEAAYWRALRILLDVGLHTRRFDFDGAMEFMQSKVDWSPYIAERELFRYTRTPTQALSYYTGKLEIFRVKEAYRKLKGDSFSMKQFHQDLLNCGSLPPKAIEWKLGLREIEAPSLTPV